MLQSFKRYWLVLILLLAGSQSMFGFALLGPFNESFQTAVIGYNLSGDELDFGNNGGSADLGGPKNIGQGYRWNVPTVYYAERSDWTTYFGSNGIAEVDKAFAEFNTLSNVSSYTSNLSEWSFDTRRMNYTAEALDLTDIKSVTMSLMMEQLGFAQPDRYVYCLRARELPIGAVCPNYDYLVIMRNYDPVTQTYSSFVNNTLYGFEIGELCTITPAPFGALQADAVEYTTDPTTANSAVAADVLLDGGYYTGLSRDDVGGLRYMYESNYVFEETGPNGSQLEVTNAPQVLVTSNLALFIEQYQTNDPAALQALYPSLEILSSSNYFSNVMTTNIVFVLTNNPFGIPGEPGLVAVKVVSNSFQQFFSYVFGNVVTNGFGTHSYAKGFVVTNIIASGGAPTAPAGFTGTTNLTSKPTLVAFTNGDFYIIPAGLCGGFSFDTNIPPITNVILVTNLISSALTTNVFGGVSISSESLITFFTNYQYIVFPITCVTNGASLREGIEKINFVRMDFDSIIGTAWGPVTNVYNQTFVTNGAPQVQTFQRVVTRPDILFTTGDNIVIGANLISINAIFRSTPNFNTSLVPGGAFGPFGPGTIEPGAGGGISFSFNTVGPLFENETEPFVGEVSILGGGTFTTPIVTDTNTEPVFRWGSYDQTTNAPIVYPDSTSIANLENQIFFQIITPSPLSYSLSQPFSVTLQATGGSPPYTWLTNGQPPGLTLSPTTGVLSGTLVGAQTNINVTFEAQVEDAGARITQALLTIVVGP